MSKEQLIENINKLSGFIEFQYNVKTYDKSNGQPLEGIYAIVKKYKQGSHYLCFGKTEIEALEFALNTLEKSKEQSEYAENFISTYCSKCTHNSDPYKNYRICDTLDTCFAQIDGEPTEFRVID